MSYKKLLSLENILSQSVLCMAVQHECGAYIPLNLVHGRQVIFALDNIDFQEEHQMGRGQLHATVSVAYQAESNDARYTRVPILEASNDITLTHKMYVYKMMTCTVLPSSKPVYPSFLEYESMHLDLDMNMDIKRFTLLARLRMDVGRRHPSRQRRR